MELAFVTLERCEGSVRYHVPMETFRKSHPLVCGFLEKDCHCEEIDMSEKHILHSKMMREAHRMVLDKRGSALGTFSKIFSNFYD